MSKIANILAVKGHKVFTIDHDATVYEAIQVMAQHNIGSILVTKQGVFCGILTERDYLRRIALAGRTSKTTRVHEVMTQDLVCAEPSQSIEDCMTIMTQKRIRHLPVMEGEELVGMISIGDLVKTFAQDKDLEVRYLQDYITGKYPG